ncbi:DUF6318 family protein [Ornithinimicrobium sp. INDO-MA30-4]|uniref:DUF6318 family protein n=1 Tax=Ornithinimicrobium sp. INDO-MA30-4 TaxID=2908651 RepID=UPI001F3D1F3F|nr:DUF6318 family protein [Ornithinimicrobium sp. INDO-MA30-4]UJH69865.1 DUF6318 family protein [Ornithinimicrobium sp. INDO-MA30-4]
MRRYFVASALALGLALSACSDAGEPSMPPSGDGARSTTAVPSDDQVVATTEAPSKAAEPTAMPTSEMEESVEGAEAFATYYMSLINATVSDPRTGLFTEFASPSCEGCLNLENSVSDLQADGLSGPDTVISYSEPRIEMTGSTYVAQFDANQDAYDLVDSNGTVVRSVEGAQGLLVQLNLRWDTTGWVVDSFASASV